MKPTTLNKHRLNNLLVRRLLEQPDAYEEVVFDEALEQRSPVSYQLATGH